MPGFGNSFDDGRRGSGHQTCFHIRNCGIRSEITSIEKKGTVIAILNPQNVGIYWTSFVDTYEFLPKLDAECS